MFKCYVMYSKLVQMELIIKKVMTSVCIMLMKNVIIRYIAFTMYFVE